MNLNIIKVIFIMVGILCLMASKIFASAPDVYGISSRASATSGLGTFENPDPSLVYQNPAFLSQASNIHAQLGWMGASEFFEPIDGIVTQNELSGKSVASGDISTNYPDLSGISFGLILPVRKEIPKIVFGTTGFLPWGSLVTIHTLGNYVPIYTNYYSRPKRFSLIAGASVEPLKNLSVGVAANIYLTSGAYTNINLNEANSMVSLSMDMMPAVSPIVGGRYEWNAWAFDLAYRAKVDYVMTLQNKTELPLLRANGSDATIPIVEFLSKTSMFYDPQMIHFGISHLFKNQLQVGLGGTWKNWRRYKAPLNQVSFTNPGAIQSQLPDIHFRDIMSLSGGMEYPLGSVLVRAGYRYEPQHVGFQEANSNFIDTDAHVFSSGVGIASLFGKLFLPIHLDLHVQYHYLNPQRILKAGSTVVGYKEGGYMAQGSLLNYGLTLGTTF